MPGTSLGAGATTSVNKTDKSHIPRSGMGLVFIKHVLLYFRHCAGLDIHHCEMGTSMSTLRDEKTETQSRCIPSGHLQPVRGTGDTARYQKLPTLISPGTKVAVCKQASETLGGNVGDSRR